MPKLNKSILPVSVHCLNVSKQFRREWILYQCTLDIPFGQRLGVTGPNGSGKTTLLRMLAGMVTPASGSIQWEKEGGVLIPSEDWFRYLTYASPGMELILEYTLQEFLDLHIRLNGMLEGYGTVQELISFMELQAHRDKALKYFSSGMMQRVRLGLAFCTQSSIVILDEPGSYLDVKSHGWYQELFQMTNQSRTYIIASNDEKDLGGVDARVHIPDWKKKI